MLAGMDNESISATSRQIIVICCSASTEPYKGSTSDVLRDGNIIPLLVSPLIKVQAGSRDSERSTNTTGNLSLALYQL